MKVIKSDVVAHLPGLWLHSPKHAVMLSRKIQSDEK